MDSQSNKPLYSVLVAGDIDLKKYDSTVIVEPYVAYKYSQRAKIREQSIEMYKTIIKNYNVEDDLLTGTLLNIKLQEIEEMTDEEYFETITSGMSYDKNTGDAITTINPNGKYSQILEPTLETTVPLFDLKYECLVSEIPPKNISLESIKKCEEYWDYLMNCSDLVKKDYVSAFKDKKTYVNVMTEPIFYNAFVSNETGWVEQGDENQIDWILTFRKRFLEKLKKDTKLKVYNFIK